MNGVAIAPIRDVLGTSTDIDAAYAIQEINTDRKSPQGRRISGRKIGVTSKAVQQQIGVDQPDFGTLFVDTEYGDGIEIPASRLIQPRAEGEVALVLEHDLDNAPHGFAEVVGAVAFALPAIEVVDSRIENWQISHRRHDRRQRQLRRLRRRLAAGAAATVRHPHGSDEHVASTATRCRPASARVPGQPAPRRPLAGRRAVRARYSVARRRRVDDRCARSVAAAQRATRWWPRLKPSASSSGKIQRLPASRAASQVARPTAR